jgi:O-antigen biosynthesis protein
MKRYIIFGPIWHHRSAGLIVLYNFQKELIRRGYDCIYYCFGSEHIAVDEVTDDDVVIYPEIVNGNPLNAKNVVRWLLNIPGVCGGDGIYKESDLIYCFLPNTTYPNMRGYLCISSFDEKLKDLGLPREHNLIWVYKGAAKKRIPIEGIEITFDWPKSKNKLIDLLQRCKTFYSYDDTTSLAYEARLCGCDVKLVNADGTVVPFPFPVENDNYLLQSKLLIDQFVETTQSLK